jgi:hypothetical protein
MNLLRLGAIFSLLPLLLPAQGVTEVIPQSLGAINISADGRFVLHWSSTSPSYLGVYDSATGVTTSVPFIPGGGTPSQGYTPVKAFSGNGQVVAVTTAASNLPQWPGSIYQQVYVIDMATASVELVSKDSSGVAGNNHSGGPSLSDDGRLVAFASGASNLVIGDTNGTGDVFVHDRVTHVTTRVSANGTYQATGASSQAAISGDGNWILYWTNDLTLTGCSYCLYDRTTGVNTCASGACFGSSDLQQISRNGQYITHMSWVSGQCCTHVKNLWTGSSVPATVLPNGTPVGATGLLSPDGGFLYFEDSVNPFYSKRRYLRDIAAGVTHVVSLDSGGVIHDDPCVMIYTPQGSLVIYCNGAGGGVSDYGRHLTFHSHSVLAPGGVVNAWNTYIHHRTPHLASPASVTMGTTAALALSAVEHPGKSYLVGLSTGYAPGILVDWRWAPLVQSDLLTYSLTLGAPYFAGFQGMLDASGNGAAAVQIPVAAGLAGASFRAAFAVLDPAAASGIAAFSNAAPTVIQ